MPKKRPDAEGDFVRVFDLAGSLSFLPNFSRNDLARSATSLEP